MKSESDDRIHEEESETPYSDISGGPTKYGPNDIHLPHPQATDDNCKTTQQNTFRILVGQKPSGHKGKISYDPTDRMMIWIKNPIAAKQGYKPIIGLMENPNYKGMERKDIVQYYHNIQNKSTFFDNGCIEDPNVIIKAYQDKKALRTVNNSTRPGPVGRTGRSH